MRQKMQTNGLISRGGIWIAAFVAFMTGASSLAQFTLQKPLDPNERHVTLIRQDTSDCSGRDVTATDPSAIGGTVIVMRERDGNTSVTIAMTATPNTTYRLSIKCVRPLGDVKTDDEGIANTPFTFPTGLAGAVYSFEAVAGSAPGMKYQSTQVSFQ